MNDSTSKPLDIDVWIDFGCPFSRVAIQELKKAIDLYNKPTNVKLHMLRLDTDAPDDYKKTTIEALCANENITPEKAQAMLEPIYELGKTYNLTFNFDIARGGNTYNAFKLLKLAHTHNKQLGIATELFDAHFQNGLLISDKEVLKQVAANHNLPADEVERALNTDQFDSDLATDEKLSITIGIENTPFALFDFRNKVPGQKTVSDYAILLNQTL